MEIWNIEVGSLPNNISWWNQHNWTKIDKITAWPVTRSIKDRIEFLQIYIKYGTLITFFEHYLINNPCLVIE